MRQTNRKNEIFSRILSVITAFSGILLCAVALYAQQLTEPLPFSVLTSETVRLHASVPDTIKVKSVLFYAIHGSHTQNGAQTMLIGMAEKEPYYLLFDPVSLPDQDMTRLSLYCDVIDQSGRVISGADKAIRNLALDRHAEFFQAAVFARYDENPTQGDSTGACSFNCGDNRITFQAWYGKKELLFFINVRDRYVFSEYTPVAWPRKHVWEDDFVQFSFDPAFSRGRFMGPSDKVVRISPQGFVCVGAEDDPLDDIPDSAGLIRTTARISGSLNSDAGGPDTGYSLLAAIPFSFLGRTPAPGDTFGFNVHITDKESRGDLRLWGSFSGATRLQFANPSEWGKLVFLPAERRVSHLLPLLAAAAAVAFLLILLFRKKQPASSTAAAKADEDPFRTQISEYIASAFRDPDLTLERTAAHFNYSRGYFGKTFKAIFKENFVDYLTRLRVEEAKRRLSATSENVSQIAFGAGYDNLDTFLKAFKRQTGLTPTQFRESGQKTG